MTIEVQDLILEEIRALRNDMKSLEERSARTEERVAALQTAANAKANARAGIWGAVAGGLVGLVPTLVALFK